MRKIPILWRACLLSRLAELRANAGLRLATVVTWLALIGVLAATPAALESLGAAADLPLTLGFLVLLLTVLWPLGADEPAFERPLEAVADIPYGALWLGENLARILYLVGSAWVTVLAGLDRDVSGQFTALGLGFGVVGIAFGGAGVGRWLAWRRTPLPKGLTPPGVGLALGTVTAGLAWLGFGSLILLTGLLGIAGLAGLFGGMAVFQPTTQARSAAVVQLLLRYVPRGEGLVAMAKLEAIRVTRTTWFWIFLGSVLCTGLGPSVLCAGAAVLCQTGRAESQGLSSSGASSLLMLASAAPAIAAAMRGSAWPETVYGGERRARQARLLGCLLLSGLLFVPLVLFALGLSGDGDAIPLYTLGILLTTLAGHDVSERLAPVRSPFLNLLVPIFTGGLAGAFVVMLAMALGRVFGMVWPTLAVATPVGLYVVWIAVRLWARDRPTPETVSGLPR